MEGFRTARLGVLIQRSKEPDAWPAYPVLCGMCVNAPFQNGVTDDAPQRLNRAPPVRARVRRPKW